MYMVNGDGTKEYLAWTDIANFDKASEANKYSLTDNEIMAVMKTKLHAAIIKNFGDDAIWGEVPSKTYYWERGKAEAWFLGERTDDDNLPNIILCNTETSRYDATRRFGIGLYRNGIGCIYDYDVGSNYDYYHKDKNDGNPLTDSQLNKMVNGVVGRIIRSLKREQSKNR